MNKRQLYENAQLLYKMERYQDALSLLDRIIGIYPNEKEAWLNKGVALFTVNRLEEAVICFSKAAEINPQSEEAWLNHAIILEKINKYKDALESYEQVLKLNPENQDALGGQQLCRKELRQEIYRGWEI